MNVKLSDIQLSRRTITYSLAAIIVFALFTRLLAGYSYVHLFDLPYYIDWSTGLHEGFFNAYEHITSLDYPPLFLFPLYLVGFLTRNPAIAEVQPYHMLALKSVQILFDVAILPLLYWVLRKKGQFPALLMTAIWALNPATIINSAYWGQTDSLMMFFLLAAFYLLDQKRLEWATIVYCLACLTKFQCLYFAPVFLAFLFTQYPLKRILHSIAAGAIVVLGVFLPFMLNSGIDLPFRVYFGGHGKYPYATLNAFNFYGALDMNNVLDNQPLIGSLTLSNISTVILIAIVGLTLLMYWKAPRKSPWVLNFMLMQTIFMFTTRMHERYQIPVLIFCLVAAIYHENPKLLRVFLLQSVMIFLNESILFLKVTFDYAAPWTELYPQIMVVVSWLNLAVYADSMIQSIKTLFNEEKTPRPIQEQQLEIL